MTMLRNMEATLEQTLKQRVEALEQEVAELKLRLQKRPVVTKDWHNSLGIIEDTPFAREAFALGEEWRKSQTDP